ncbi:hypothetical protein EDD18DRAFT_1433250 [Armillaria luteobubalina]|uniref:Uncharacterized protein n=1 Tax=Armillaria luteobubalina TaxID=153913 RepID=A0AA39PFH6_9AGAR|nr:hypothetical protein EDD18DRAFT_1433250 [Armillaria luteobubalina]
MRSDDPEDDSQLETDIQLVENSTAYFSRRQGKSTRGTMSIQRKYIMKGNPIYLLQVKETIHSTTKNQPNRDQVAWIPRREIDSVLLPSYQSQTKREQNPKLDKQLSLSEHSASLRPAELFTDILDDPLGQLAVVRCYQGKLKVLTLENEVHIKDVDISIPEKSILSNALLSLPNEGFALAIFHIDNHNRLQLLARDLIVGTSASGLRLQMYIANTAPAGRTPNTKDVAGF